MKQEEYFKKITKKALENNKLPIAEEAELLSWINDSNENKKKFLEWNILWGHLETIEEIDDDVIELHWQALKYKLFNKETKVKTRSIKPWLKYAAVFLLGIGLAGATLAVLNLNQINALAESQIVDVPTGSKSIIHLADGTVVTLNAGSRLVHSSRFAYKKREVFLDGEAYFQIAKHSRKPFVVSTSKVKITAYGTEFNVRSYQSDPMIETTLIEGRISVERIAMGDKKEKVYYLKPNEQVIFRKSNNEADNTEGGIIISKGVDAKKITSWMGGEIYLRSETISNLIVKLQRRYDVKIYLNDSTLRDLKFTGTIKNETIEQVMDAIQVTSPVTYRIKNREIWLSRDETK